MGGEVLGWQTLYKGIMFFIRDTTKGGRVASFFPSTRETYFLIRALTKGGMVAEWQILYKGNII